MMAHHTPGFHSFFVIRRFISAALSALTIVSQSAPTMSETASLNERKVHLASVMINESVGEDSKSALEQPSQDDNDSSGDQGAAPIVEHSKSPSIDAAATSFNEESNRSAAVKGKQSDERIENLVALFRDFLEATPNPATSGHTHTQRNTGGRKRFFGLTKGLSPETSLNNRYDYEQKYPRDPPGEEAAENARVWLTYLDEAESFDRERVEGWKETADVLLVFAGLFSGVITTFVSQASQSLQKDNTQVSASLLFEIAQILRAQSSGTPLNNIPSSTLTPTSPFTPSTTAFLVNGLWFTSLAITLSTALFAVLAKQWLYYYLTSITGTAHEKVRARQLRFKGFELWKVGAIVDLLPILLHLAVGIFLTGIIILLFPLDIRVAWTIVIITGTTYFLYFISVILPIRYPECPYTTSLTIYVGVLVFSLRSILRLISATWRKFSQVVGRSINYKALHYIHRLLQHTYSVFRHAFCSIFKLAGVLRRGFRKLRDTIFTEELPKFTNWREENIKKAVKNAVLLDFEALHWLYATSPNRSVHRIIARCVAVHPVIGQPFRLNIRENLCRSLEVSETNIVDLRYGLCLDFLAYDLHHWCLLRSISSVEESQLGEAEFRTYSRIAGNVITENYGQIMKDAINNDLKLPLAMWQYFFVGNTVAAHILINGQCGLFKWKPDPTRESTYNTGIVSLNSEELGWWKFDCIFRYFFDDTQPDYSLNKTVEIRFLLLNTIYCNLTSNQPLISDREQRQESLSNLFLNFCEWVLFRPRRLSLAPKHYLTFFKDIFCVDAFWSESMTGRARRCAVDCLSEILDRIDPDVADRIPFTECHDLTPIYRWCSRDLNQQSMLLYTAPMFTLLFMPHNRPGLCTILSNDSDAVSHFSTCLRNLGKWNFDFSENDPTEIYLHQSIMNLFMSADPNGPLFTILYNPCVLGELWKYRSFRQLNEKKTLSILKSKLDPQRLHDLHGIMIVEVQAEQNTKRRSALEVSARGFGQSIGVACSQLQPGVENQSTEERSHDYEERAQSEEPNENESSIVHRMKKYYSPFGRR